MFTVLARAGTYAILFAITKGDTFLGKNSEQSDISIAQIALDCALPYIRRLIFRPGDIFVIIARMLTGREMRTESKPVAGALF